MNRKNGCSARRRKRRLRSMPPLPGECALFSSLAPARGAAAPALPPVMRAAFWNVRFLPGAGGGGVPFFAAAGYAPAVSRQEEGRPAAAPARAAPGRIHAVFHKPFFEIFLVRPRWLCYFAYRTRHRRRSFFRSVPCSPFPSRPRILRSTSLLKNACCNGCPRTIPACSCSGRTPPASSWGAIR